jgi:DNA-binding response OmpR family regulator
MKDGKHVILCVDDDPDVLESLKLFLSAKYHVETVAGAADGLQRYKQLRPDLVLVDLMMEEIDAGAAFVRDLKALGPTPPIYMLSAVGDSLNSTTDFSSLGLNGILQKPVEPRKLLALLEANLGR